MILHNYISTARKRSCGKVMFLQVSVIVFTGGVLSQHALQVVSQHALQQVSGGGLSKHALQVSRPKPKGEVEGDLARGVPALGAVPAPRGCLLWGGCCLGGCLLPGGVPAPGGCLLRGVPAPRGVWRPPCDGYCCERYASYWNAFLFIIDLHHSYSKLSEMLENIRKVCK